MTTLDEILAHNAHWVVERNRPKTKVATQKVAILTCMDIQLGGILGEAMGLGPANVSMIQHTSTNLVDPPGESVRSLLLAIYGLGCAEVLVIGHLDCGLSQVDEAALRGAMLKRGVAPAVIDSLEPDLAAWVDAWRDPLGNVQRVVAALRQNPLLPPDLPVHGLLFDPQSGSLGLVEEGYGGWGRLPAPAPAPLEGRRWASHA